MKLALLLVVAVVALGPARLARPEARHVTPRGRALMRRIRRERRVHVLPHQGVIVGLALRRHATHLAQREVRIGTRTFRPRETSTGVRELVAVTDPDVVPGFVHLELTHPGGVVIVVAR